MVFPRLKCVSEGKVLLTLLWNNDSWVKQYAKVHFPSEVLGYSDQGFSMFPADIIHTVTDFK